MPFPEKPQPNEKVYDLTPFLSKSKAQNLPLTLSALAKVTGINIVQEHFFTSEGYIFPLNKEAWKGTLPQLLHAICQHWGYSFVKQGDTYLFWSDTWAFDREADISERKVARWRKLLQRQGEFGVQDEIAIALESTWPQVRATLPQILTDEVQPHDENGEIIHHLRWLNVKSVYHSLRVQGLLTPDQRRVALSGEGIPVSSLSPLLASEVVALELSRRGEPASSRRGEALRRAALAGRLSLSVPQGRRRETPLGVRVTMDEPPAP